MTAARPPLTLHAAIGKARADERARCIAFLRSEADRQEAFEVVGPEAEVYVGDSASFAAAASLLTVWAQGLAVGPEEESGDVEAEIRADERKKCGAILRKQAAQYGKNGETTAAMTATYLANEIDPLGPVMGAPAAGGTS